jgi:hypothetical protein
LILALSLAPAAAVFTIIFALSSYLQAPAAGVLLGSMAAALLLLVEAGIGIKLLGGVFERFDLSSESLQEA